MSPRNAPPSDPQLKRWFNAYNRKYFANRLPPDTVVKWASQDEMRRVCGIRSRKKTMWGLAGYETFVEREIPVIRLDDLLRRQKWFSMAKMTLLHEQIHILLRCRDKHGPAFDREMLRLAAENAFHGLW